ncbi:hypothetical protein [Aurantiacibacter rhizosphaerae]|uniref:Uncharacterized protein n=1 Tax=Aurantiacibacter rhizosphaerae TaxID=2691582 RepID=A0A844XIR2_9SPHN|nr:hypothetical protein [Aurantiacibacter rhizosphaerae]MWV29434.1 hypothetical protein [Aurantiacibacter rhizosphaerae]
MIRITSLAALSFLALAACGDADTPTTGSEAVETAETPTQASASAQDATTDQQTASEPAPAPADAETTARSDGQREVRCHITNDRGLDFDQQCLFRAQSNGSFALSKADEAPLFENITMVNVSKTGTNSAEVRGLTTDGINSRWGEATRSTDDPACWTGADFEVCAY